MQRDMKIGMALGVALMGIVAAMFYRREPEPKEPSPPPLTDAAALDRQISENPRIPYINGLDEFPETSHRATPPNAALAPPGLKHDAFTLPGFLTKVDEADHQAFLSGRPTPPPDPLVVSGATERRAAEPVPGQLSAADQGPAHNRDWLPGTASQSGPIRNRRTSSADNPPPAQTHVIRPGDTLSNLAARYLGNSARYRDLYEANRHVLRSPDDLPEGATLVIPDSLRNDAGSNPAGGAAAPSRQTPARAASNGNGTGPAAFSEGSPGQIRFAPVRRGSFSAGRVPPTGSASIPDRPGAKVEFDGVDPFE